ncbi:MAG: hypothetical protein H0V82_00100 [Candidatus Protochlamydia sp.]|nr:hypothetical protein [Candidatus Protochlamydia sp.]
MAVIRIVAYAAFTALLAFKLSATMFVWPVIAAGTAFVGWTIYSHLLSNDPLMEVFYKLAGGKERFEVLPEINLPQTPGGKISKAINRINWDDLNLPLVRAKTIDGRNIVIVKGLSRMNDGLTGIRAQTKSILAFIERANPGDFKNRHTALQNHISALMEAILLIENNNFSYKHGRDAYEIRSSISTNMANEFYAQLANPA